MLSRPVRIVARLACRDVERDCPDNVSSTSLSRACNDNTSLDMFLNVVAQHGTNKCTIDLYLVVHYVL
jgi:hypothetical protein